MTTNRYNPKGLMETLTSNSHLSDTNTIGQISDRLDLHRAKGGSDVDFFEERHFDKKSTAIIEYTKKGYTGTVQFLIDNNANVNAVNQHNNSALHKAMMLKNVHHEEKVINVLAKALVKGHADVNLFNDENLTPLMLAAIDGLDVAAQAMIESKDAEVNIQNKDGMTALMFAAQNFSKKTVKHLLAADTKNENFTLVNSKGDKAVEILMDKMLKGSDKLQKGFICLKEFLLKGVDISQYAELEGLTQLLKNHYGKNDDAKDCYKRITQPGLFAKMKPVVTSSNIIFSAMGSPPAFITISAPTPATKTTTTSSVTPTVIPAPASVQTLNPNIPQAGTVTKDLDDDNLKSTGMRGPK